MMCKIPPSVSRQGRKTVKNLVALLRCAGLIPVDNITQMGRYCRLVLAPVYNVGGVVNIFFPVARGIFMRLEANL